MLDKIKNKQLYYLYINLKKIMSQNINKLYFPNKESTKKLNIFRNGFNIYNSSAFDTKKKEEVNNSFQSIEPILFEKHLNIPKNNILNGISNRYNNNQHFHKRKNNYNSFNPSPNIEEIPTFSYENDLNLNSYKEHINKKNKFIEKNYSNYLKYIKKFDNNDRKTPLISPYSLYIKKIKDVKKYSDNTSLTSREKESNDLNLEINRFDNRNKYININNSNSMISINNNENNDSYIIKNNSYKDIYSQKNNNEKFTKDMPISKSLKNIKYYGRKNEISNPELFYKRSDENFYRYREEQRKFGDYNYNIVLKKNKSRFIRKEPDINPFNPKIDSYKIGKSSLPHNTILKPEDFYGYYNNI